MPNWLSLTKLEGTKVDLIPLEKSHRDDLLAAVADGRLWEIWYTAVPSESTIDAYLDAAFQARANGTALPFVVVSKDEGRIIGSTRYYNADADNRRVEIGYTWYAKSYQRTGVNTECKYLLLRHAFGSLDAIAVEFRTHWFNHRSRNAILRLGARQDGVLRNHRIDQNGLLRDTVVFSIIRSEWKTVKKSLEFEMGRYER